MPRRILSSIVHLLETRCRRPAPVRAVAPRAPGYARPPVEAACDRRQRNHGGREAELLPWVSNPSEAWRDFERLLQQARQLRGRD